MKNTHLFKTDQSEFLGIRIDKQNPFRSFYLFRPSAGFINEQHSDGTGNRNTFFKRSEFLSPQKFRLIPENHQRHLRPIKKPFQKGYQQ